MAAPVSPEGCKATLAVKPHFEYPQALKTMKVKVKDPQRGLVAELNALSIDRSKCNDFLATMDAESDELRNLALRIFDREGKLHRRLVDHEYHRGSGCWGPEMDSGILIHINDIDVPQEVCSGLDLGFWVAELCPSFATGAWELWLSRLY